MAYNHNHWKEVGAGFLVGFLLLVGLTLTMFFQPNRSGVEYAIGVTTHSIYYSLMLLVIVTLLGIISRFDSASEGHFAKKVVFATTPLFFIVLFRPVLLPNTHELLLFVCSVVIVFVFSSFYKTKEERMSTGISKWKNVLGFFSSLAGVLAPAGFIGYLLWGFDIVDVSFLNLESQWIHLVGVIVSCMTAFFLISTLGNKVYGWFRPLIGFFSDRMLEKSVIIGFFTLLGIASIVISFITDLFIGGLVFLPIFVAMGSFWVALVGLNGRSVAGADDAFIKESLWWNLFLLAVLFFVTIIVPSSFGGGALFGWLCFSLWFIGGACLIKYFPETNVRFSKFGTYVMVAIVGVSVISYGATEIIGMNLQSATKLTTSLSSAKTPTTKASPKKIAKKTITPVKKATVIAKKSVPKKATKVVKKSSPKKLGKKTATTKKKATVVAKKPIVTSKKSIAKKIAKVAKKTAVTLKKSTAKKGTQVAKKTVVMPKKSAPKTATTVVKKTFPRKVTKKTTVVAKKSVAIPKKSIAKKVIVEVKKVVKKPRVDISFLTSSVKTPTVVSVKKVAKKKAVNLSKYAYANVKVSTRRLGLVKVFSLYDDIGYALRKVRYYNDPKLGRVYIYKKDIEEYDLTHVKVGSTLYKIQ